MVDLVPVTKELVRRYIALFSKDNINSTCRDYSLADFRLKRNIQNLIQYLFIGDNVKPSSVLFRNKIESVRFVIQKERGYQHWRIVFSVTDVDIPDLSIDKALDFSNMLSLVNKMYNQNTVDDALNTIRTTNDALQDIELLLEGRRCYIVDRILKLKTKFFITYHFEPDI